MRQKQTNYTKVTLLPLDCSLSLQLGLDNVQRTRSDASYKPTTGTSYVAQHNSSRGVGTVKR